MGDLSPLPFSRIYKRRGSIHCELALAPPSQQIADQEIDGCRIYSFSSCGSYLSGDAFEILESETKGTYLLMCDAQGHEISSKLIATQIASAFKSFALMGLTPGKIIENINHLFHEQFRKKHKMTRQMSTALIVHLHHQESRPPEENENIRTVEIACAGGSCILAKWLEAQSRYLFLDIPHETPQLALASRTCLFELNQKLQDIRYELDYLAAPQQSDTGKPGANSWRQRKIDQLENDLMHQQAELTRYEEQAQKSLDMSNILGLLPKSSFTSLSLELELGEKDALIGWTDGLTEVQSDTDFCIPLLLYYSGNFEHYVEIARKNGKNSSFPIYAGKAVPKGWRQARLAEGQSTSLYTRLKEHMRSIEQVENLAVKDFRCRFMILDEEENDLIGTVEATLIRLYSPLWNCVIDGFGNHDPGSGRYGQAKSEWDILHPGRPWAERLTGKVVSLESIIEQVREYRINS